MNWAIVSGEWQQLTLRLRRLWGKLAGAGPENPQKPVAPPSQGAMT
jgi:hypothetical protein